MASRAVRERLAQDVGTWLTEGLIDAGTHDLLRERYQVSTLGAAQLVKTLGVMGGMFALFGLLGLIAALSGSKAVGVLMLLATGGGLLFGGARLLQDRRGRYGFSAKAVLTLGVLCVSAGVALMLSEASESTRIVLLGVLLLPGVTWLAHQLRSGFLLALATMGFFHWVGSWHGMMGRSTYATSIHDPLLMSVAALAVIGIGVLHERRYQRETGRFFHVYETFGLIYLNLSLLILSLFPGRDGAPLLWIAVLTLAGIAQVALGARLHNSLFVGFGVTSLGVNLFTRYFEHFWEALSKGIFLVLGGVVLLALGVGMELWMKGHPARRA